MIRLLEHATVALVLLVFAWAVIVCVVWLVVQISALVR
jgi:hypothetical protein